MRKLTALAMAATLICGSVQLANAADTTTTTAAAAPGSEMTHGQMKHPPMAGPMGDHMFKGLNLTEKQRDMMREIARDAMKNSPKPSPEEHKQLHDIIAADSFDAAKAKSLVESMSAAQNARMVARLETQNKMYNVLTPAQKQEFNKRAEQRSEKMSAADKN